MRSTQYANAHVAAMSPYVPGEQPTEPGWIKLNTNENAFPPSPRAIAAISETLGTDGSSLKLYPSPDSRPLREAIARHHNLDADQVIAGNGCDDILNLLLRTFAGPDKPAGMTVPSYSLYQVLANGAGAPMRRVPFDRSMQLDTAAIHAAGANLFLLTNPNAPTGVQFAPEGIAQLARGLDGILVVDETYAPFADQDCTALLAEHSNVVITRSFSKAYSLAGLRLGYALSATEIVSLLDRVRDSYNLDRLAQAAALAAIEDRAYFDHVIAKTRKLRDETTAYYRDGLGHPGDRDSPLPALLSPKRSDEVTHLAARSRFGLAVEGQVRLRFRRQSFPRLRLVADQVHELRRTQGPRRS